MNKGFGVNILLNNAFFVIRVYGRSQVLINK